MRYLPALLLIILLVVGCEPKPTVPPNPPQETPQEPTIPFHKDGTLDIIRDQETLLSIDIEIADTDSSRARGLMQRTSLPDKSGMLFLFPYQEVQTFWMANTPLALDMLFIDADSQIVDIAKYTRPFSPDPVTSRTAAKFVLEVPAGFSDQHGLIETDRVRWQ